MTPNCSPQNRPDKQPSTLWKFVSRIAHHNVPNPTYVQKSCRRGSRITTHFRLGWSHCTEVFGVFFQNLLKTMFFMFFSDICTCFSKSHIHAGFSKNQDSLRQDGRNWGWQATGFLNTRPPGRGGVSYSGGVVLYCMWAGTLFLLI